MASHSTPFDPKTLLSQLLFRVTNETECHNGFQYKSGLNVLKGRFSSYQSCVEGGLYFTTLSYILDYIDYGVNIRIVSLDKVMDLAGFMICKDDEKYRSNMFFLEEPMSLSEPSTYEFLMIMLLDIRSYAMPILLHAIKHSFIKVVKFLHETFGEGFMRDLCGSDVISKVIKDGSIEIYDYLCGVHPKIKKIKSSVYEIDSIIGRSNVAFIKKLIEQGFDLGHERTNAMVRALQEGNEELFLYLEENCKANPGETFLQSIQRSIINNPDNLHSMYINFSSKNRPEIFDHIGFDFGVLPLSVMTQCITSAIFYSNHSMIDYLIEKISDLTFDNNAILREAIARNNMDLVSKLLLRVSPQCEKLLNKKDPTYRKIPVNLQYPILETIIALRRYEIAEYLMDFYKDPAYLKLILKFACKTRDLNMIKILLEKGVDYDSNSKAIFNIISTNPHCELEFFGRFKGIITEENIRLNMIPQSNPNHFIDNERKYYMGVC